MATSDASILVGEYRLYVSKGRLWIAREGGEAMALSDENAIQALTELWDKWF